MSRTKKPDGRAWADFFLEHDRSLTAYALSLTGNMADAEDLIQDVLVRMVQQRRPVHKAKPFVMRCLRNLAIDRHRATRARPSVTGLSDAEATAAATGAAFIDTQTVDLARRETAQRVKAALDALSADRREVIVLKIYAGLTFREIAGVLDRPIGTVASTYARGIDELRAACDRELKDVI